jgi:hypothetical protein
VKMKVKMKVKMNARTYRSQSFKVASSKLKC